MTENLTTYTEVDPNGHISVSASRVTLAGLTRDESARLYKDFGAGHFNKIDISFAFYLSSTSQNDCMVTTGLSNTSDGTSLGVAYFAYRESNNPGSSGVWYICCQIASGPTVLIKSRVSSKTVYYGKIEREASSATINFYLYADAGHTNLIASKSGTIGTSDTYRYFYAVRSSNQELSGAPFDGYFENFDLGGNIASRNGVSWGSISKINGTAIGNISKINGVEV
jgi:hypothetical protein